MNRISATNLILIACRDFGLTLLALLGVIITISCGFLVIRAGLNLVWHSDGTTNWLGRHWSWYDQRTYKPYPKYNRLRSRNWNMEHTFE